MPTDRQELERLRTKYSGQSVSSDREGLNRLREKYAQPDVQGPPQAPSELAGMRFDAPVDMPDATFAASRAVPQLAQIGAGGPGNEPPGYQIRPGRFSIEDLDSPYYDLSPEDQQKARIALSHFSPEALKRSGFKIGGRDVVPPEKPYGTLRGMEQAFTSGLTGQTQGEPVQGASPIATGVSALVGEGAKYVGLIGLLRGAGVGAFASELGAAGISGATREGPSITEGEGIFDRPFLENVAEEVAMIGAAGRLLRSLKGSLRGQPKPQPVAEAPKAVRTARPTKPTRRVKVEKQPWKMTRDELFETVKRKQVEERALEERILGDDVVRWRRAQRRQNSRDNEIADAAGKEIAEIESKLTQRDVDALYGIGEKGLGAEALEPFLDVLDNLDTRSPQQLGRSLANALTDVGLKTDPLKMTYGEQIAFTQIRGALAAAKDLGWSEATVFKSALSAARKRFRDPADAELMLSRYLKLKPTLAQVKKPLDLKMVREWRLDAERILSRDLKPPPKPKPSTTVSFMGANPQVAAQLGRNVVDAAKSISKSTSAMVEGIKGKPEIRSGVQAFKDVAIEHDRMIRNSEFTAKELEKVIRDAVPDPKRQMLMTKAYEHKLKGQYWNQLTDLEKAMVRFASGEKAKLNKFVADNKIVQMLPESKEINHIKHEWQNPETLKPYRAFYGKFTKRAVGGHERKIATIEQGEKLGLVHAETNLGKLIGDEWIDMMRAHQARQMFKTIHSIGAEEGTNIVLRKGAKPKPIRMIERWDLLEKQGLSDGYVRYSHPSLDKTLAFRGADGNMVMLKGAVGVRKEIYPFLRAYMENPKYGTLSKLNFATKSLKLGMSLFHVSALGMQELANFRVPFRNIPRGLRIGKDLGPEMKLLYQEGLELFKGYEDLGYRNQFFEGLTTAGKVGNVVTKPVELMRDFIFNVVQPGMKTSFAYDQLHKMLPRYLKGTGWTTEMVLDAVAKGKPLPKQALKAARDVVKKADGHFSGEHWKRSLLETNRFMVKMYFSPEARKFWQAALLSPTWQREHLLVAKNVAKSFMPDKMIKKLGMEEIGPIKSQYRKYALGAISMIGSVDLWNMMSTQIMDGKAKHIWENPEGKGFAVRAWWNEPSYKVTDKNGKVRTVQGGAAYIRPLKSVFEVAEWANDPFKKFAYKLSPGVTAMGRQIFPSRYQKEYKGIEDMPKRALDFVLDVGTPIMVDQIVDVVKGKKTPLAGALPFFGMPTSKVKDISPAQWKRRRGIERMAILDLYGTGKGSEAAARRREWDKAHPDMRFTGEDINTDEIKRRRRHLARRGR